MATGVQAGGVKATGSKGPGAPAVKRRVRGAVPVYVAETPGPAMCALVFRVGRSDETLVNGICQIAPLDVASKQALLEAGDLAARADLLVQFMQFQRMVPGGADGPETLQ